MSIWMLEGLLHTINYLRPRDADVLQQYHKIEDGKDSCGSPRACELCSILQSIIIVLWTLECGGTAACSWLGSVGLDYIQRLGCKEERAGAVTRCSGKKTWGPRPYNQTKLTGRLNAYSEQMLHGLTRCSGCIVTMTCGRAIFWHLQGDGGSYQAALCATVGSELPSKVQDPYQDPRNTSLSHPKPYNHHDDYRIP